MGLAEIFAILKGTVSLIPATSDVIAKIKKSKKQATLNRIVDTFTEDTIESCDNLIKQINVVRNILHDNDFDLSKRIDENQEPLGMWNLQKNFFLSRSTKRLREIQSTLTSSIEEVGRILMCNGTFSNMEEFDKFVVNTTKEINGIENKSINDILSYYETLLLEYKKNMRGK